VEIERFAPGDTEAVVALWHEVFPDDPARNDPAAMVERKRARDPELFWVARIDGLVCGALMAGYDGVRGWLYHLAVAPGARRQGVATALVDAAVQELHSLGCHKINLQVRESNAGVLAFYESLGWGVEPIVSMGRVLPDPG